ncbi:MAG: site-specific DNA-methyltransferase [Thermoplasmata archaeon]|nr:site-specific DNA-methyltransferase [Thermoplasmata archaeon]
MKKGRSFIGDSREMSVLKDGEIDLIVTSPPYWHIKDYGVADQIGYGHSLHDYLKDLYRVWMECFRVLLPGRRLCINIGDQFARSSVYGRYKVIPLHAEIISQCEDIGFDSMGSIIWQKRTTMNTSGGATIMGSYPHPPNGIIEIDYEYILIFKKPGKAKKMDKADKEGSALSKEDWKLYHTGHWNFKGARQIGHEAMFPVELPRRLIKMFSFRNEQVLDPFMGSGSTALASMEEGRVPVGFEINDDFLPIMEEKLGDLMKDIELIRTEAGDIPAVDYMPRIRDAQPQMEDMVEDRKQLLKVVDTGTDTITLSDGRVIGFLGVEIVDPEGTRRYLHDLVRNRQVYLRSEEGHDHLYVYLKNRIFINSHLIRSGLGAVKGDVDFSMKKRFLKLEQNRS